jgi:hypothetical protein
MCTKLQDGIKLEMVPKFLLIKSLNVAKRGPSVTDQIAPYDVIARVVEIDVFAAPQVHSFVKALLLDAVNLKDCPASDDNLKVIGNVIEYHFT